MRIYHGPSAREATPIQGPNDPVPVYKCFLPGSKKNLDSNARKFERIEDAALFLKSHSGAGIRVAAVGTKTGQRTAIINADLVIEP